MEKRWSLVVQRWGWWAHRPRRGGLIELQAGARCRSVLAQVLSRWRVRPWEHSLQVGIKSRVPCCSKIRIPDCGEGLQDNRWGVGRKGLREESNDDTVCRLNEGAPIARRCVVRPPVCCENLTIADGPIECIEIILFLLVDKFRVIWVSGVILLVGP